MADHRSANPRIIAKHPGRNRIRGTKSAQQIHDETMKREPEKLHLAHHGLIPHHKK